MKKVLFLILCCAVFAVGCNKAAEVPAAETEQVEAVSSDVAASTDTLTLCYRNFYIFCFYFYIL